jgi:hypothetical protein
MRSQASFGELPGLRPVTLNYGKIMVFPLSFGVARNFGLVYKLGLVCNGLGWPSSPRGWPFLSNS